MGRGARVLKSVEILDHRPVRYAHAERQPAAAERLGGRHLLREGQRVPRIGRHDPHAKLDTAGPHAGHRQHVKRVDAAREMHAPGGAEPVGFGVHYVRHDVLR
jgi:hypothetical protein